MFWSQLHLSIIHNQKSLFLWPHSTILLLWRTVPGGKYMRNHFGPAHQIKQAPCYLVCNQVTCYSDCLSAKSIFQCLVPESVRLISDEWSHINSGYSSSKQWSSQLWSQFKQLRIEAWKSTSTGFESVTSRYRCDALTNWAMKPLTLGAGFFRLQYAIA